MKFLKIFTIALAACVALASCQKEDGSKQETEKSTPAVGFSFKANQTVLDALTMTLKVDGEAINFSSQNGSGTVSLKKTSGTIEFVCINDAAKTYTEAVDLSLSVSILAGSYVNNDESTFSSVATIAANSINSKGCPADKVSEKLTNLANALSVSKTYTVDDSGKVAIK